MKRVAGAVIVVVWLAGSAWAIWRLWDSGEDVPPARTEARASADPEPDDREGTMVVVPNEVGKPGLRAAVHLHNLGLEVSIVYAASVTVPERVVVEQDPAQGTEAPVGSVVELTISTGRP